MEQWILDGRRIIAERGKSLVPKVAEADGFTEDLSGGGMRGLLKKTLRKGISSQTPNVYSTCVASYQYIFNDNIVEERDETNPVSVIAGAGHVTQGFEEALMSMTPMEKSAFWMDPGFAFREKGLVGERHSIPAHAPVKLIVELISFERPLTRMEKLSSARAVKDEGNAQLRAGDTQAAVASYRRALDILSGPFVDPPEPRVSETRNGGGEEEDGANSNEGRKDPTPEADAVVVDDLTEERRLSQERRNLLAILHTNVAVCYFTQNDDDRCLSACSTALAFDPAYPKAYARRAFVHQRRGNYDEALKIFAKMLQDNIGDAKEVTDLIHTTEAAKKADECRKEGQYRKMFGGATTQPST